MKKRILAALLMLALLLSAVPAGVLAADGDWTEQAAGLTEGQYTDETAVAADGYEYMVVGSDGSMQTVTVQANEQVVESTEPTISWTRRTEDVEHKRINFSSHYVAHNGAIHITDYVNGSSYTANGKTYAKYTAMPWKWTDSAAESWTKPLADLVNDKTATQSAIWDGDTAQSYAKFADNHQNGTNDFLEGDMHKISGSFIWPAGYDFDSTKITIKSAKDGEYSAIYDYIAAHPELAAHFEGDTVIGVNDDVFCVVWVGNDRPTTTNINSHLAFWSGVSSKGIWTQNGLTGNDAARTTTTTFVAANQQARRAFNGSFPNLVGVTPGLTNSDVVNSTEVSDALSHSDGWYTLLDQYAVDSNLRKNYTSTQIKEGTEVHIDLYVVNTGGTGAMDRLTVKLEKMAPTEANVTVNYYVDTVADANLLGSSVLASQTIGEAVTLKQGVGAGQLNFYKATAEQKNPLATVSDGVQINAPVVEADGSTVVNVVYNTQAKTFNVVHIQNGKQVGAAEQIDLTSSYDLTGKVTSGYLYGGTFADPACNTQYPFGSGESGKSFAPQANATYYIWEVDAKYLKPSCYYLWKNLDGQPDITNLYLLAPIDRLQYSKAGFTVNGTDYDAAGDADGVAFGAVEVNRSGKLYDYIYVKDGAIKNHRGETVADKDEGYIDLLRLNDELVTAFRNQTKISIKPYWVTLDGVKVVAYERVIRYQGVGYKTAEKISDGRADELTPAASDATALRFAAAYAADYDETPAVPTEPVEPTPETVTVTVHDNGKTYEQPVQKGDATGALTYSAPAGKLFAGWFLDEACKTPADFRNVQEDLEVYAKYVSNAYLRVKTVNKLTLGGRKATLISAVDGKDYAETGFVVNGEKIALSQYVKRVGIYNGRILFGVESNAPLMTWELALGGRVGEKLTVTPYWVTQDGTTVYGASRTFTVTRFGLQG